MARSALGTKGEELAAEYLEKKGYRLVERKWRCRQGEIDLIFQDGETLVLVEVKAKSTENFGSPEDMVNARKQHKLQLLAQLYPSRCPQKRIDVVALVFSHEGKLLRLNHYLNAVTD